MRTTVPALVTLAAAAAGMLLAGCGTAVDTPAAAPAAGRRSSAAGSRPAPTSRRCSPARRSTTPRSPATFNNDGTYSVVSFDTSNKELDYAGTYQIMESGVGNITQIRCSQVMPSTAQAEGMYQIDTTQTPARMQYEVVQTQPTNGLTPPDADQGLRLDGLQRLADLRR